MEIIIILGISMLAAAAGLLGVVVLLQNQGMLGDAISHAALPGTIAAFLLFQTKNVCILGIGGLITAAIGVLCVEMIIATTPIKKDTAIGTILSTFFGAGLVLVTIAQKQPLQGHALLYRLLLGNAALLSLDDVIAISIVSLAIIVSICVTYLHLGYFLFDKAHAQSVGYPVQLIQCFIMFAVLICMSLGLQMVGGILMSSLLLAPAAAARQWSNSLSILLCLAACFGAIAGFLGSAVSLYIQNVPTGPAIVFAVSAIMGISFVCGSRRQKIYMRM